MMKRILALGLIVTVLSFGLFANPLARIYQVDDPLWHVIEDLSWESGVNPFTPSGPVSGYELERHLQKIDKHKLTEQSKKLLTETINHINDPYEGKLFDYAVTAAIEGYANTNDSFQFYDWVEGYVDRTPPLSFQVESNFG